MRDTERVTSMGKAEREPRTFISTPFEKSERAKKERAIDKAQRENENSLGGWLQGFCLSFVRLCMIERVSQSELSGSSYNNRMKE